MTKEADSLNVLIARFIATLLNLGLTPHVTGACITAHDALGLISGQCPPHGCAVGVHRSHPVRYPDKRSRAAVFSSWQEWGVHVFYGVHFCQGNPSRDL